MIDNETDIAILFHEMGTLQLKLVDVQREQLRRPLPDVSRPVAPQRVRIADAANRCVARRGVQKTTVDDVAREAGCSRATVYRTFPGGKEEVISAVVDTEVARLFSALAVSMGEADDIEDALVVGMVYTATAIGEHQALQYVVSNEPGVLLPHLCFAPLGAVLERVCEFAVPFLARWMDPNKARRVADLATRIVLSYVATPALGIDLTNEQTTRRLVATFLMPATRSTELPNTELLNTEVPIVTNSELPNSELTGFSI
jgi:AcrR family transcriptional regulator